MKENNTIRIEGAAAVEGIDQAYHRYAEKKELIAAYLRKVVNFAQIYVVRDGTWGFVGHYSGGRADSSFQAYLTYRATYTEVSYFAPLLSRMMWTIFALYQGSDYMVNTPTGTHQIGTLSMKETIEHMKNCPELQHFIQEFFTIQHLDFETFGWANVIEFIDEIQRAFGFNTFTNKWQKEDILNENQEIERDRHKFVANTADWWENFEIGNNWLVNQPMISQIYKDYYIYKQTNEKFALNSIVPDHYWRILDQFQSQEYHQSLLNWALINGQNPADMDIMKLLKILPWITFWPINYVDYPFMSRPGKLERV